MKVLKLAVLRDPLLINKTKANAVLRGNKAVTCTSCSSIVTVAEATKQLFKMILPNVGQPFSKSLLTALPEKLNATGVICMKCGVSRWGYLPSSIKFYTPNKY